MKFFDEVKIEVVVGDGGNGVVMFCCEKFIFFGGLDGGDGGCGGSIYVVVDCNINMLIDYCYMCYFCVQCGENGCGVDCYGKGGDDMDLCVLVGIIIIDVNIGEVIVDLVCDG